MRGSLEEDCDEEDGVVGIEEDLEDLEEVADETDLSVGFVEDEAEFE